MLTHQQGAVAAAESSAHGDQQLVAVHAGGDGQGQQDASTVANDGGHLGPVDLTADPADAISGSQQGRQAMAEPDGADCTAGAVNELSHAGQVIEQFDRGAQAPDQSGNDQQRGQLGGGGPGAGDVASEREESGHWKAPVSPTAAAYGLAGGVNGCRLHHQFQVQMAGGPEGPASGRFGCRGALPDGAAGGGHCPALPTT